MVAASWGSSCPYQRKLAALTSRLSQWMMAKTMAGCCNNGCDHSTDERSGRHCNFFIFFISFIYCLFTIVILGAIAMDEGCDSEWWLCQWMQSHYKRLMAMAMDGGHDTGWWLWWWMLALTMNVSMPMDNSMTLGGGLDNSSPVHSSMLSSHLFANS